MQMDENWANKRFNVNGIQDEKRNKLQQNFEKIRILLHFIFIENRIGWMHVKPFGGTIEKGKCFRCK